MIILICGQPRAGKTTYSKNFTCPVLHLDEIHSYRDVLLKVKDITDDIVVEGIYELPIDREKLLAAYKGKGSKCIYMNTPIKIRQERLGFKLDHEIYHFYPPTYEEGWDQIIEITETEKNIDMN